jgi:Holliday junction resolvase RusA-like endonuclease
MLQCGQYRNLNLDSRFELYLDVFFASDRQDLDNALKGTLDNLQSVKAIKNDRLCLKIVAQKFVDKKQPRIEFYLKTV